MKIVEDLEKVFEWIDFPQGRIGYAGSAKGRDEPPINTFAIYFRGQINYGEIKDSYLPNGNDFNLGVVSFGWPK